MRRTRIRRGLRITAVLAAGAYLVACGSSSSPNDYLTEARATGTVPTTMDDAELLATGRMICSAAPGANQATAFGETPPQIVAVAKRYCDSVFMTAPTTGAPTAAPSTGATAPVNSPTVALGQRFDVPDGASGAVVAQVAITDIQVDPHCTAKYGTVHPAEHGHYIAIGLDVQTQQNLTARSTFGYPSGYDFTVTGSDGYTEGQVYSSSSCIADRQTFGTPMVASHKYRGWVLIDSPTPTGTLTFRPHFDTTWAGATIPIPASGSGHADAQSPRNTSTSGGIGETDYPAMRAHIEANHGQATSPAESQYLYACQTHSRPVDQSPTS